MIFDTSFVIDLMDNKKEALSKFQEIEQRRKSWGIASPSLFELWSGVARSKYPEKEKMKIKKILRSQPVIQLDQESAEIAGKIDGELIKKGKTIEPNDSMIAGITMANNETLVTGNKKHFSRIKNLQIESY